MIVAAIDPGLSGAIALYRPGAGWLEVSDMPTLQRNGRREVDAVALSDILTSAGPVALCALEEVHAMPRDGVGGAFRFGASFGAIVATVMLARTPICRVSAVAWKRHYGLGKDKAESRARASELFPAHAGAWKLKKHDGRAEAALLARYAALKLVPGCA